MNVLGFQEAAMKANSDLQIWDNAAFDNGGDSEDANLVRTSWTPTKPNFLISSLSSDSFSSKENQTPGTIKSPVSSTKPPALILPLHPNRAIRSSQNNSVNPLPKPGFNQKKIDKEIEEIESEISRLSSRLESLKLEKAMRSMEMQQKQWKTVFDRSLEEKQSIITKHIKMEEETVQSSAKSKIRKRGFSMGPNEILEKSRQSGKQEIITAVQPIQNRRKSCLWKLQNIDEEEAKEENEKVIRKRGEFFSLSPKSRKTANFSKIQGSRQVVTSVGLKKSVPKEDGILKNIEPKRLFVKDGEKSAPAKKPSKLAGRVVPSRYNQSITNSSLRKRSLPENDESSKRLEKRRASLIAKSEGRVKKRWEFPSEIVVAKRLELEKEEEDSESPLTIKEARDKLPRIRAAHCPNETPRDSGPAKRVAELIGRKSYFHDDDEETEQVCQVLSFPEYAGEGD